MIVTELFFLLSLIEELVKIYSGLVEYLYW